MKKTLILILLFLNSTLVFSQKYEGDFENKTSYEVLQQNTDNSYSFEIKDTKSGRKFKLLNGKVKTNEAFDESESIPSIVKIFEVDFDKKNLKEIVLEYSITYATQKGESGADYKKVTFLKIINLDNGKTLLDKSFYEETSNFFYNHYLNDDFIERSDYSYKYEKNNGSNYFISDSTVKFVGLSEEDVNKDKTYKYNPAKNIFEEK